MQPIRRWYEHRSRGLRLFLQLWHSNQSFWFILILWGITGYRSLRAYQQLAQELRPDNQPCSSSSTCLHIQIPLHLALLGQILSLYMLYEIITTIFWPVDYVGEGILVTVVVLNNWYRWNSLMIVIPSFLVLIFMHQNDNVVQWISGLYAIFRAGLFVAYFILMMHRGRRKPLITNIMWRNLFVQAIFQIAVLLTLNFRGRSLLRLENDNAAHAEKVKNTFIFNTFVFCQVFNEFNSRKPEELNIFQGVMRNHLFIGIVGITVILQVLIIEFLGKFTSTVRLSWKLWLVSLAIAFFSWIIAVVGKLIPVSKKLFGELICSCLLRKKMMLKLRQRSLVKMEQFEQQGPNLLTLKN